MNQILLFPTLNALLFALLLRPFFTVLFTLEPFTKIGAVTLKMSVVFFVFLNSFRINSSPQDGQDVQSQ